MDPGAAEWEAGKILQKTAVPFFTGKVITPFNLQMKFTYLLIIILAFAPPVSAQSNQTDSVPFATVCFYRAYIPEMHAPVKKVPIFINDSLVHRLKANTILTKKIYSEGKCRIAIDDNGETTISQKIKFGTTYFFKCEVVNGLWFGKPTIRAVAPIIGEAECEVLEVKTAKKK